MKNKIATPAGPLGLLQRLLDEPQTPAVIQGLDARTLGKLIRHIGLEDAGEIISLASRDQLMQIFDEDLWHSDRPGMEERFDPERFGLWLEVMLEMGAKTAAQKLAEMDYDLVTLALTQNLLVLNTDTLRLNFPGDDPEDDLLVDKALESSISYEFGSYLVISRNDDAWNALLAILTELDSGWHDFLSRILDRCWRVSSEYIEDSGGLHQVLTAAERLRSDVAEQREDRREKQGFVPPLEAAHFLSLARLASPDECLQAAAPDPVTRSYFKAYAGSLRPPAAPDHPAPGPSTLISVLAKSGFLPEEPQPSQLFLNSAANERHEGPDLMREGLAGLKTQNEPLHFQRLLELRYLANVLLAACELQSRRVRPLEAAQAALAVSNLGLEYCLTLDPAGLQPGAPVMWLSTHDAVKLFRTGWSILHRDVSLRVWTRLTEVLAGLLPSPGAPKGSDRQTAGWLAELEARLAAGNPWAVKDKLDMLEAFFDARTWRILKALLAECPSLPAGMKAETAQQLLPDPEFICSRKQVDQVQDFLRTLKAGL